MRYDAIGEGNGEWLDGGKRARRLVRFAGDEAWKKGEWWLIKCSSTTSRAVKLVAVEYRKD